MKSVLIGTVLTLGLGRRALAAGGEPPILARAPEPTAAPDAEAVRRNLLKNRAVTADGILTCGFVSGDASRPLTCRSGATCDADSSIVDGLTYSVFGCCSAGASDCTLPTSCYESTEYWTSLTRTLNNWETACTDATAPICQILYESGYEAFGCGSAASTQYVFFSASGGSGGPSSITYTSPSTPSPTPSGSSVSGSSVTSPSGSSTSPTPGSSSSSTSATSTLPVTPGQTSPAPVVVSTGLSTGAIVGIAVAAAAVALAAIFGIGCVCWQRYRRRQNAEPPAVVANVQPPAGHGTAQFTNVEPSGFNSMTQPNKDEFRFSGSTVAGDHYGPTGNKIDNMPPLRPVDAVDELETGTNIMSNAGHTVTSVASEGYNPPRV